MKRKNLTWNKSTKAVPCGIVAWYVGCAASPSRLFKGSFILFIVEKAKRLPEYIAIIVMIKIQ